MPKASLRDQIVTAAVTTLHQKGFNGTSVQDITDAAGAPKGSFYNHFTGKEALAAEALEAYWSKGLDRLVVLDNEALLAIDRLQLYFRALNAFGTDNRFSSGCMLGNFAAEMADLSEPLRRKLADLLDRWTTAIKDCVEKGQRDGSIRGDLAAATMASFLLNSWEGAVLRAKVIKEGDPLAAFEALAFESIAPRG